MCRSSHSCDDDGDNDISSTLPLALAWVLAIVFSVRATRAAPICCATDATTHSPADDDDEDDDDDDDDDDDEDAAVALAV